MDLGGPFLWVNCNSGYSSSTYRPAGCRSAQCSLAQGACFTNTCSLTLDNSVTHKASGGHLGSDVISLLSSQDSKPGPNVTIPNFLFACAPTFLLNGLARGSVGMARLGRGRVALPSLFASAFSFPRKFAICLPGVAFFGSSPYIFQTPPGADLSFY